MNNAFLIKTIFLMHINLAFLEINKQTKISVMNNFQTADYRDTYIHTSTYIFTYQIKHNILFHKPNLHRN